MLQDQETSAFAARIAKLMERVEYRRADSLEDKQAIYRMRYEAYRREGYIAENASGMFSDVEDEKPNAWLIGVFIDGALASSIRLHIASRPEHYMPGVKVFPEILGPLLVEGQVQIDATRQSSRLEFTRAYPFLPLITMRCGFVAMKYFGADILWGTCRSEYQPAFRRMFGSKTMSEPKLYPLLSKMHVLMGYDCKTQWQPTLARYPFLASGPEEQRALFGRSSTRDEDLHDELTAGRRAGLSGSKQTSTTYVA